MFDVNYRQKMDQVDGYSTMKTQMQHLELGKMGSSARLLLRIRNHRLGRTSRQSRTILHLLVRRQVVGPGNKCGILFVSFECLYSKVTYLDHIHHITRSCLRHARAGRSHIHPP
jgi:hypothetical protein